MKDVRKIFKIFDPPWWHFTELISTVGFPKSGDSSALPLIIADVMLIISFVCALKIDMDLELPINKDAMKGLRSILTNFEILLFLVMMFVCGIMYGFVETFLFVFLKEDLHAPMYLLGLTITTGAVVSLPFLYYSDSVVKKVKDLTPVCFLIISSPLYSF